MPLFWFEGLGLGGAGSLVDGSLVALAVPRQDLSLSRADYREKRTQGRDRVPSSSLGLVLIAHLQREMGRVWLMNGLMVSIWHFVT